MSKAARRAVFLDRDGVIVAAKLIGQQPHAPVNLTELRLVPDVHRQLDRLKAAGFLLPVVTNQPDIRRGLVARSMVDEMHRRLLTELPIDGIYLCPHDDRDECSCRKPKPGLIGQAASDYNVDLKTSFLIGDRWRDVDAGAAAGCRTVLIDYGYAERRPANTPNATVASLPQAIDWILAR